MAKEANAHVISPSLELRVSDLKQYAYCPRIVYYQYVMPVDREPTYKMAHGKEAQVSLEALEKRRKLRAYRLDSAAPDDPTNRGLKDGLDSGERIFNLWLRSERLGLNGRLDLLIHTVQGYYPVDFKYTEGGVRRNHVLQLAAYALLVEERYETAVETGFLYLIPAKDVVVLALTDEMKREVLETLAKVRRMIRQEAMPPPTPVRARCKDCEYQNYCADIW